MRPQFIIADSPTCEGSPARIGCASGNVGRQAINGIAVVGESLTALSALFTGGAAVANKESRIAAAFRETSYLKRRVSEV